MNGECAVCGTPMAWAYSVACSEECRQTFHSMNATEKQEGGDHYKSMKVQPVEFIHSNKIPFIEGAVIKYVSRHRAKNGAEDIKKAIHFLELLLELEYDRT